MQLAAQKQDVHIEEVSSKTSHEFDRIFDLQKEAFLNNPAPNAKERIRRLKQLKKLVIANQATIPDAISADFGHRSQNESLFAEIFQAWNQHAIPLNMSENG